MTCQIKTPCFQYFGFFGIVFKGSHHQNESVDTVIHQSWIKRNRWKLTVLVGLLLTGIILFWLSRPAAMVVEEDTLNIGTVTYGDFQEIIVAGGSVEPETSVLIDAKEGGTILAIKAEEGEMVKAGDVLVTLQNEALILDYMQRETQIVEQINNLRNTRIALEQNLRTVRDQLDDYQKEEWAAHRQYLSDSALFTIHGIARNEYLGSKESYEHLRSKSKLYSERLSRDKTYQQQQFQRIDASIGLMERNLDLIRSTIEEMSVKAPVSGQLNAFSLEVGQVLQRNESVGRVDVPGRLVIRALVDQHYLNRVRMGQMATIEYGGKTYDLSVKKVQTIVQNGQFELLLSFDSEVPENLRRGQSFQVRIAVSAQTKALMIPRGAFFQTSGGEHVYVLSGDGSEATKRSVSLGKQNPDFYEVVSGLEKGERVIVSSYDAFKGRENINIQPK